MEKNSLQKKIIILSVSIVVITVVAFSVIIGIRLYTARNEIVEQGRSAVEQIQAASGDKYSEEDMKELIDQLNKLTGGSVRLSDENLSKVMIRLLILSVALILLAIVLSILFSRKVAKPYIQKLVDISSQKERMETELNIATEIQAGILPKDFPLYPERKEFDVYASMDPAREVGGDFYDIFLIDDDHLALVVGDVSDKGVPAALFMMITKALIKTGTPGEVSPADILEKVNNQLADADINEMFVTVWLGILTISTGEMVTANAGHEDPFIRSRDGEFALKKSPHGLVLGSMKNMKYNNEKIILAPGDLLFMYTDGLAEATNSDGERWGLDSVTKALNDHKTSSPAELLQEIKTDADAYVGDAKQFDDLTMLAIEYKGA